MLKRIAIISETFPPDLCGVADYVLILAKKLSKNYEVHIVTRQIQKPKHYYIDGILVHEIMISKLYILNILWLLAKYDPDIIDVQLSYSLSSNLHKKNLFSLCNSILLRLTFRKAKLFCTVHELTTVLESENLFLSIYRKIRDYCHTRFFNYYFCVDKRYLAYFKSEKKEFISNFSNIPTLDKKAKADSLSILYFGTITKTKNIEKLIILFKNLLDYNKNFKLILVGGIIDYSELEFSNLLALVPSNNISYLGRLDTDELAEVIKKCSYALFPFKVLDKNASVLAMLVNGLVVIAETDEKLEYSKYGNNFFGVNELTIDNILKVVKFTFNLEIEYCDNAKLIDANVKQRILAYESIN